MAKILTGIIVTVLVGLLLSTGSQGDDAQDKLTIQFLTWDQFLNTVCNSDFAQYLQICNGYTSSTSTTTASGVITGGDGASTSPSSTTPASSSSSSNSPLQNALWCRFSNGSYLSLGQTFIYNQCSICQCTQSRQIRCSNLQCMGTYCIDNTTPSVRSGQCCSQCAYENNSTACVINGISFPTGILLRSTSDNIQCWCQLGTIECRKVSTTLLSSLGNGTTVYIIVIVICAIVLIGSLLCLGTGMFFYYYYKQDQQAQQQAYEQYYNSAGWQPMGEDGQIVDPNAEEKKVEAEQQQYEYTTGNDEQYIPPPYALYNGPYTNAQEKQI